MKAMVLSDLLIMRNTLLQLAGICVIIGAVMCYATESIVGGMPAVAAMVPFMYLFSSAAIDELNGWERFRLALPLSRRQVIFGRYASLFIVTVGATVFAILLGFVISAVAEFLTDGQSDTLFAALTFAENPPFALLSATCLTFFVILAGAAVALPLIARFGTTRATRFVPLVVVISPALGASVLGDSALSLGFFSDLDAWIAAGAYGNIALVLGIAIAAALAVYAASALVAAKLYEQREF